MLARREHLQTLGIVQARRRTEVDDVNIILTTELIQASSDTANAVQGCQLARPRLVDITDGNHVEPVRKAAESLDVSLADAAADHRDTQPIAHLARFPSRLACASACSANCDAKKQCS